MTKPVLVDTLFLTTSAIFSVIITYPLRKQTEEAEINAPPRKYFNKVRMSTVLDPFLNLNEKKKIKWNSKLKLLQTKYGRIHKRQPFLIVFSPNAKKVSKLII